MVKHRYVKQGPDACLRQIGDAELFQHRVCNRVTNGKGSPLYLAHYQTVGYIDDAMLVELRPRQQTRIYKQDTSEIVKGDNAEGLLAQPNIDGALVGGASLDAAGFGKTIESAERLAESAERE